MIKTTFIPGNVPSLKNSKVKTSRGIFPSATVVLYLRSLNIQQYSVRKKKVKGYVDKTKPNRFAQAFKGWTKPDKRIFVGFHFVRNSKRKFDFNNATQIIQDLMVAHDYIEDDDMSWFIPMVWHKEGEFYSIDREKPGVYLCFKSEEQVLKEFNGQNSIN